MNFLKKHYGLILVLVLSFWAIKPLFAQGFFPMHDNTQVARVFEMGKMLKAGMFPVRWVPDLGYGYGYPIFNFYAPLAYYVGGTFTLMGFDALLATKIMMALGVILSGIFMYLLARNFFGELGGIVSGLFYIYAPYHAVDIYVRGDVAEFWAYAFIPLAFFGFYKVYRLASVVWGHVPSFLPASAPLTSSKMRAVGSPPTGATPWIILGGIGYAGIILSHNLTALMVTPFLLIVCLLFIILSKKETRLHTTYCILFTAILGLAISAFYWLPALSEMKYTNVLSQIGGGADFRDHFVCLSQLWTSPWGFGGSAKNCIDGMSFMIGKLHILSALSIIPISLYLGAKRKYFNNIYYLSIFSIAGFIIAIFLMLNLSKFLWEAIPFMSFFQYPWRFLIMVSFFSSILSGAIVVLSSQFKIKPYFTAFLLVFFLLFFNFKLFVPQTIFPSTASDFTNEKALKWTASRISDEYLPSNFRKPKSEKEIAKNPIPFKETRLEKASNIVSFIGILALIIGIIFVTNKKLRYE
ncbi:MAG: hypothetical protein Q7R31_02570 [Candidatus Levybacteria bacterium]|nr:hypothetical protein [Candidatus Levybacteria bacterium]